MNKDSTPVHATLALGKHAIIEASAGTGKTYTIQNLVVRILLGSEEIAIDRILILTFTEKATAELKTKIRTQIQESLAAESSDSDNRQRLQKALDQFDSAQIFTIHGFCQRVLQQYAFDNGESFKLELLTSDDDIFRRLLREQQRTHWPERYGADLCEMLSISDYPGTDDAWETKVLKLAREYDDSTAPRDRILPEFPPDLDWPALTAGMRKTLDTLLTLAGNINPKSWRESDLVLRYDQLKKPAQNIRLPRINQFFVPLLKLLHSHKTRPATIGAAMEFICLESKLTGFAENGFGFLKVPGAAWLDPVVESIQELEALKPLQHYLSVAAMLRLKADAEKHKKEYGLFSFDDMLRRLDTALDGSRNKSAAALKNKLRERYRYALVDESQDTDRVQWNILRRIYLDDPGAGPARNLFLIGDPKQAIYGFRGADVNVYLRARKCLEDSGAQLVPLGENWRSTPPLQNALNALFSAQWTEENGAGDSWFGASREIGQQIAYSPVKPVPDERRKAAVVSDKSERTPVTVVDFSLSATPAKARFQMARFTAREIERLMNGGGIHLRTSQGNRPLRLDDICILVRTNKDAVPVERALDEHRIPHSFYKKQGLYQTDEAAHLSYIFSAIAYAGDSQAFLKALLTHFFRVPVGELQRHADLPPEHPIKKLFDKWRRQAEWRDWASLFSSIVEDTGVVLQYVSAFENAEGEDANEPVDIERRVTNYQQILEDLELEARRRHLDFIGILERLNRCRQRSIDLGLDTDLHRIETEKPKVQIMTMHACKGLEFPVVFLAGGFTAFKNYRYFKFHDAGGGLVYDLTLNPENKPKHESEQDQEDRRLFYVALTRAQYKLYIPKIPKCGRNPGPLCRFVYNALGAAWENYDGAAVQIVTPETASAKTTASPATVATKPAPDSYILKKALANADLFSDKDTDAIKNRTLSLESYSSLKIEKTTHQRAFGEETRHKGADEIESGGLVDRPAMAPQSAQTSGPPLPRGKETGSFLHDVLEHLEYRQFEALAGWRGLLKQEDFMGLLRAAGRRNQNYAWDRYKDAIARLVWNVLRVPLGNDGFSLAQLTAEERRHEVEFHFPLPTGIEIERGLLQELGIEAGDSGRNGFLTGFIDLVFRRKDENGGVRYCILDWKSDSLENFGPAAMQACMDEKGYTLQYKIYSLALARWLAQSGLDFESHFGGIYYIFLRGAGMSPGDPSAGIFRPDPDETPDLIRWEKELFGMLNRKAEA